MNDRRLQALRALAERPGTEAEGRVARAILEKWESRKEDSAGEDPLKQFANLRTKNLDDIVEEIGKIPCDCGMVNPPFSACSNIAQHEKIAREIRTKFPKKKIVYYNHWQYTFLYLRPVQKTNAPGVITGYSKRWNWVRIKFDHLKFVCTVPVYSRKGWHLFDYPVDRETLIQAGLQEGLETFEQLSRERNERRDA